MVANESNYQYLFRLHEAALKGIQKYSRKRYLYNHVNPKIGKHFLGIMGLRGVGKSILLKQWASELPNSLYISIDTLEDVSIFELIKTLSESFGITSFLLDEIHYYKNINADLKKIYDLLEVKIIFTSSVALAMHDTAHDLSRRVKLETIYPFSYGEYLYFKQEISLPTLSLEEILAYKTTPHLQSGYEMDTYLQGGNMPFALEEPDMLPLLKNILNTIIEKDIPRIHTLNTSELTDIHKCVEFIGLSGIDGINYTSISKNLKITKYKAEQYINLLCKAFVLHRLRPKGTNVTQEPKILMQLPFRLLYSHYEDSIGAIREDFTVDMLQSAGNEIYYLKSTRGSKTPDFLICHNKKNIVIEVGGKTKGRTQFKNIKYDEKYIFSHDTKVDNIRRPLFLLGFLR
ncbi:MAG: ATP-binding protein [Candidatus Margulisbacteria bacterium]|nr:ATP-binding protein [Candidatus Margulisiibacteriota bacterium]